jgi:hypothetical protein
MDTDRWLDYFRRNALGRQEPDWFAPITLPGGAHESLLRSLEQFQLGDGGGPASLIARDAERFRGSSPRMRELVDYWFAEEKEHSRLLEGLVHRFGGKRIEGHWSFTAFCLCRKWFGVRFELTVLLLTEIASTAYYRLLRRHGEDAALKDVCRLILRDEAGHIAFHRARLAASGGAFGGTWAARFRALGFSAATMLWINHGGALRALGATRGEFYREVWGELFRFIRMLRVESEVWATAQSPTAEWVILP